MKTITLTGPESTGKSWLTKSLAEFFQTSYTKEYLRQFYDENNGIKQEQMQIVAEQQNQLETQLMNQECSLLFFDTNIITLKIYYQYYFKKVPQWFEELYSPQKYDYYFLLDTSVPWILDPQRDSPKVREELYHLFKEELETLEVDYTILSGNYEERFDQAKQTIDRLLS